MKKLLLTACNLHTQDKHFFTYNLFLFCFCFFNWAFCGLWGFGKLEVVNLLGLERLATGLNVLCLWMMDLTLLGNDVKTLPRLTHSNNCFHCCHLSCLALCCDTPKCFRPANCQNVCVYSCAHIWWVDLIRSMWQLITLLITIESVRAYVVLWLSSEVVLT